MWLFGKRKDENKTIKAFYVDGIIQYRKGRVCDLVIDNENERLSIAYSKNNNVPIVNLKFENIVYVGLLTKRDIVEKSKSVLGRAVVGEVVFGSLGAIIGGMSGVGTKKETIINQYLIINYKSADGTIKAISFEPISVLKFPSFIKEIRSKIIQEEEINL